MIDAMLAEAWSALVANRLRSALTMLGMIIGVAAVILMLAIGGGVQKQVSDSIAGLGSNLLIVTAGSGRQGGFLSGGAGSGATLTLEDADAITRLGNVVAAAPSKRPCTIDIATGLSFQRIRFARGVRSCAQTRVSINSCQ